MVFMAILGCKAGWEIWFLFCMTMCPTKVWASLRAQLVESSPAIQETAWNACDVGSIPGSGRFPEEGDGNPLQYSCPGNPIDKGGRRATVHVVAKSQTQLSNQTTGLLRIQEWKHPNLLKVSLRTVRASFLKHGNSFTKERWIYIRVLAVLAASFVREIVTSPLGHGLELCSRFINHGENIWTFLTCLLWGAPSCFKIRCGRRDLFIETQYLQHILAYQ